MTETIQVAPALEPGDKDWDPFRSTPEQQAELQRLKAVQEALDYFDPTVSPEESMKAAMAGLSPQDQELFPGARAYRDAVHDMSLELDYDSPFNTPGIQADKLADLAAMELKYADENPGQYADWLEIQGRTDEAAAVRKKLIGKAGGFLAGLQKK